MVMRRIAVVGVLWSLVLGGCSQQNDKELKTVKSRYEKVTKDYQGCQDRIVQLQDRSVKLESALKKIRAQPCELELDPVTLEVKARPNAVVHSGARPASGPPLNLAKVKTKVRSVRPTLKTCYEEAAKRDKVLGSKAQKVTLKFTIYNSGKVGNIRVLPYVGGGFVPCVKRALGSWKFEKFGGYPKSFMQRIQLTPK